MTTTHSNFDDIAMVDGDSAAEVNNQVDDQAPRYLKDDPEEANAYLKVDAVRQLMQQNCVP